jgi:Outer membrane protein beta-barrel domain
MKQLSLLVVLTLITFQLSAQNQRAEKLMKKYRFGLYGNVGRAGMNPVSGTSTIKDSAGLINSYDNKRNGGAISFGFGLNAEKPLTESVSLMTGVGVDWYGGAVQTTATSYKAEGDYAKTVNAKYSLQSVNAPLGLKLNAAKVKNKYQIFAEIGGDVSFIIGRKANMNITYRPLLGADDTLAQNGKVDILTVTPIQIGWHFGVGTEVKVSDKNALYISLLYRNGLFDATLPTFRKLADKKFDDGNVRANNISLRIGYFF